MWYYLILILWLLLWHLIYALWAISKLKETCSALSNPLLGSSAQIPCEDPSGALAASIPGTFPFHRHLPIAFHLSSVYTRGDYECHVWRSEDHLQRQALTFYHVGPRDQAQAVCLGDKSAPLPTELLSGPHSISTSQSSLVDLGRANSHWDQQPKNFQLSQ